VKHFYVRLLDPEVKGATILRNVGKAFLFLAYVKSLYVEIYQLATWCPKYRLWPAGDPKILNYLVCRKTR
jgi:hypothetical protein